MGRGAPKSKSMLSVFRKYWSISQANLSVEVGISQSELSKIENRQLPGVDPDILKRIADALRYAEHPETLLLDAPPPGQLFKKQKTKARKTA